MVRYQAARHYISFGILAFGLAVFSAWVGLDWAPAWVPAALLLASSALMLALALRPAIELHPNHLAIGKRIIHWMDIRRVDRTRWISPLVVRLTLFDDSRILLIYPGDIDSCHGLLRQLRRAARDALIDGVPYRQYWGEVLPGPGEGRARVGPRFRVLRPEDEAEVERLYQRLKAVGHLDQKTSQDEK